MDDLLWWEDGGSPGEVFIPYDRDFIRKVVMCASVWGRCNAIAITRTRDVPTDAYLLVRRDGTLAEMPSRELLFRPLVVVNSTDEALAQAAMQLAYHLGCPACEVWPERKEIVRVMVVQWVRYVNGRRA
ncbi:MAG: hypothetical protein J7601_10845 [Chloroflexi bacterium]|jgi:hypothetical protein|nr:hypothetical protein [Chloroflexota bacterium]